MQVQSTHDKLYYLILFNFWKEDSGKYSPNLKLYIMYCYSNGIFNLETPNCSCGTNAIMTETYHEGHHRCSCMCANNWVRLNETSCRYCPCINNGTCLNRPNEPVKCQWVSHDNAVLFYIHNQVSHCKCHMKGLALAMIECSHDYIMILLKCYM